MATYRRESPMRRKYPDGREVWLARYTDPRDGKRKYAAPEWNDGRSTFKLKREAARAIDEAYDVAGSRPLDESTIGGYAEEIWLDRHPRPDRTARGYLVKLRAILDVEVDGTPLREWAFADLKRKHVGGLVDLMFREQGRAVNGVRRVLAIYSAMWNDAIEDDVAPGDNPFFRYGVKASDPRCAKAPREPKVFDLTTLRAFAAKGSKGRPERLALLRTITDTGMRIGEILALRRTDFDGQGFQVRRTVDIVTGRFSDGTKNDHGEADAGRYVPAPPELAAMIAALPPRLGTDLLFPSPTGKLYRSKAFYRDLWKPARTASGLDVNPHDCRHSYVTNLQAAGINPADLAKVTGHTVETMIGHYTHGTRRSDDAIREALG